VAIEHMRAMENEMKIAQDQISARREEQERSVQSVRRLERMLYHHFFYIHC